ncbi:EAL domain-containing protein [Romeria aff. gracilis LEGE 07310]|uniref:EAL domain-containing protein n=1 Tax=Vasconcelosia minhoensis LEGE 07310 TaxID=915328 RepID=A0A8J7AA73_9CYAN|nr:hormogonium polysaccharide biosynthesis glycosyltransferase HpsE [Romeria gracilis]MBE9076976.1 EAL domain-containing protein [Romeria aff. gracilis LEGE 07310]
MLQGPLSALQPETPRSKPESATVNNAPLMADAPNPTPNTAPNRALTAQADGCVVSLDVTVAIPTYDGAKRLPLVLDRLRSQINIADIAWEIIVCDNNSSDETAEVVRRYQRIWDQEGPQAVSLHYRFAPEQGAAHARQRIATVAQGELIAFLDDDNLPACDWVEQAYRFGQAHPGAGAFGSQIHGEFSAGPPDQLTPPELAKIKPFLAIIERGDTPHLYEPQKKILPPGAGLVVRRQAWLDAVPPRLFLNNKGKAAGLASEDLEAVLHIQKAGWQVWYNPAMVVYHQISSERLEQDYLLQLLHCDGLSRFYIRMMRIRSWQRPLMIPGYIANDLRKLALNLVRRSNESSLLAACDREHLRSTVVSPFFLLRKAHQDGQQARYERRHLPQRQEWLERLTQAFEQDRFQLYSQPVIAANSHSQASGEVLLRLFDQAESASPNLGMVSPNRFIPVAEHYGLLRTLDRWVLRKFFQSLPAQSAAEGSASKLTHLPTQPQSIYSVNLSTASVCDPKLPSFIADQLQRHRFPPCQLCFEITEADAIALPVQVSQLIHGLHEIGCLVAIDDFSQCGGVEKFVSQFPIHYLKLSSHTVKAAVRNASAFEQAQSMIQLSHARSIQIVAKGVETAQALSQLKKTEVDYVQGYQLAEPQPLRF